MAVRAPQLHLTLRGFCLGAFVFLGSTIGNLTPGPRAGFLAALSDTLQPGDSLLLGTDLVKDADRLVRAASWTQISISTRSSTSPGGTPTKSVSRCGCAPPKPNACR